MFNATFLLQGASFVKSNRTMVQDSARVLAETAGIYPDVSKQLLAMSTAKSGTCNTGLSESGWRPLAEVVGMCAPRSTKMFDNSPENKRLVMDNFLHTGNYASTRKGKSGGSKADYSATAVQEQALAGVRSQDRNAQILQNDVRFIAKPLSLAESLELVRTKLAEKSNPPEIKPALAKPARSRGRK